jgi:hypothetical protein
MASAVARRNIPFGKFGGLESSMQRGRQDMLALLRFVENRTTASPAYRRQSALLRVASRPERSRLWYEPHLDRVHEDALTSGSKPIVGTTNSSIAPSHG